jgi:hypothetical protein
MVFGPSCKISACSHLCQEVHHLVHKSAPHEPHSQYFFNVILVSARTRLSLSSASVCIFITSMHATCSSTSWRWFCNNSVFLVHVRRILIFCFSCFNQFPRAGFPNCLNHQEIPCPLLRLKGQYNHKNPTIRSHTKPPQSTHSFRLHLFGIHFNIISSRPSHGVYRPRSCMHLSCVLHSLFITALVCAAAVNVASLLRSVCKCTGPCAEVGCCRSPCRIEL